MNKPVLIAAMSLGFGLFLGRMVIGGTFLFHCPRKAVQAPVVAAPVHPCHRAMYQPPSAPPAQVDPNDPDEVLTNAQTSYVNGDYLEAITLAKTVKAQRPLRAGRIIGAAACNTHDVKLVEQSFREVDAPARQYLVYVCQRNGISNHGRSFRLDQ